MKQYPAFLKKITAKFRNFLHFLTLQMDFSPIARYKMFPRGMENIGLALTGAYYRATIPHIQPLTFFTKINEISSSSRQENPPKWGGIPSTGSEIPGGPAPGCQVWPQENLTPEWNRGAVPQWGKRFGTGLFG